MPAKPERKPHLLLHGSGKSELFVAPPRMVPTKLPPRDPPKHGSKLAADYKQAIKSQIGAPDFNPRGALLKFESAPDTPLKLQTLDSARQGFELLSVVTKGGVENATVFVPLATIDHFPKLFDQYANERTDAGNPRQQAFAAPIEAVRAATITDLWTDDPEKLPKLNDLRWHELWLRTSEVKRFRELVKKLPIELLEQETRFFDRTVVLAKLALETLVKVPDAVECIAEIRTPPVASTYFLDLPAKEQATWVEDLAKRTKTPKHPKATVCLLDGGVNPGHILLKPYVGSLLAYGQQHTHDRDGHGTGMSGLILYGDLTPALSSAEPVFVPHVLESVRILQAVGKHNDPKNYGSITIGAVATAELAAPKANRVVCLPVTDRNTSYRGQPTSWSAAVDELACGGIGGQEPRRLVIVSAGNIEDSAAALKPSEYPDRNALASVHDPAQAWNALTVGACADRENPITKGWLPIAKKGGLHPNSSTGMTWPSKWPLKPDILMPGGNHGHDGAGHADALADLQMLTTHHQPGMGHQFTSFGDTSAASALAANAAAQVMAEYPEFWPETIRALLVHSAAWSAQMVAGFQPMHVKANVRNLVATCGFGIARLEQALWSARNYLTLVVQDEMQPYQYNKGNKTNDMHLHELPWPKKALQDIGEANVTMRVTLSYFVEPYPARKEYRDKNQYMSHSLLFETKSPDESVTDFRKRINKAARDEKQGAPPPPDAKHWQLGSKYRKAGSLHSDIWTGSAAQLAEAGTVAVYPGPGWWRERAKKEGYYARKARYSLLVSIHTDKQDVDLYTPVENMLKVALKV